MKNIVTILFLVFLLIGCTSKEEQVYQLPEFEESVKGKSQVVVDELLMGVIFGIEEFDNKLIVVGFMDQKFVHLFDKQTGEKIGSYVNAGRANNELTSISNFNVDRGSEKVYIYSENPKKILIVNLRNDNIGEISVDGNISAIPDHTSAVLKFNDNLLMFSDVYGNKNLKIANRLSFNNGQKQVSYLNDTPIDDVETLMKAYSQVSFKASPNQEKFAIATLFGAIIESYSMKGGVISSINTSRFIELNRAVSMSEIRYGFSDIALGDDYLYAAYCGTTDASRFNRLAIFDWQGNAIKEVNYGEMNIVRICLDSSGDIYAVIADSSSKISIAKMM